jgi:Tol biopolymer transport system component
MLVSALVASVGQAASPIPRPPDSDAPLGAAPHWLPPDMWIHLHWLPFDEARLYRLLHINRETLWSWLRDDNQTIAQLAATRGWPDAGKFADALVAPRAHDLRGGRGAHAGVVRDKHGGAAKPVTRSELRSRALRVLRQGHLSQHIVFHSMHQEAGPEAASVLFGMRTAALQRLRRLDLAPARIGRTHGRTWTSMQRGLARALHAAARRGIAGGDVSSRQAKILLQRQLRGIPRWLAEDHYNGPPQTRGGKPLYPFRPSFAAPALASGGGLVLFDAQQPAPQLAVRFGEVNLGGRNLQTGGLVDPRDASSAAREDSPCSSFNPSVSADGRFVAYEISAGNRTFGKRFGNVTVALADLQARTLRRVAGGRRDERSETAYAPSVSDDGQVVAYTTVTANPMSPSTRWAVRVGISDLRTGRRVTIPRDGAYEPAVSGDGRRVAYSAIDRGRLQTFVYDIASRRSRLVSLLPGGSVAGEAWAPSPSRDGERIAFTASVQGGDRFAVYVRDLGEAAAQRVSPAATAFADAPSLSADGASVAFTEQRAAARPDMLGRPVQRIRVRNLKTRATMIASAGATGVLPGWSAQPQISGNGTLVAFTTDAATVGDGPGGLQVMVRDLAAGRTLTASPAAPMAGLDSGTGSLDPGPTRMCDLR